MTVNVHARHAHTPDGEAGFLAAAQLCAPPPHPFLMKSLLKVYEALSQTAPPTPENILFTPTPSTRIICPPPPFFRPENICSRNFHNWVWLLCMCVSVLACMWACMWAWLQPGSMSSDCVGLRYRFLVIFLKSPLLHSSFRRFASELLLEPSRVRLLRLGSAGSGWKMLDSLGNLDTCRMAAVCSSEPQNFNDLLAVGGSCGCAPLLGWRWRTKPFAWGPMTTETTPPCLRNRTKEGAFPNWTCTMKVRLCCFLKPS